MAKSKAALPTKEGKSQKGKQRCLTDDQKVAKQIYDSLRNLSLEAIDQRVNASGRTGRQQLLHDLRESRKPESNIKFGALYFRDFRRTFAPDEGMFDALVVLGREHTMPSNALLGAIEASQAACPNKGLLLGFLNTCEKPSKSECSGILREICTWKPRIKKQLEPCLVVLRWMARVKLEKIAPQMLKATNTWIDTVLVECLKAVRHRKEDEKEWARRHSTLLQLVLPAEHLRAVLDASGSMGHLVEDPVLICMLISSICVHIGCFPTRLLGAHWMFSHMSFFLPTFMRRVASVTLAFPPASLFLPSFMRQLHIFFFLAQFHAPCCQRCSVTSISSCCLELTLLVTNLGH